MTFPIRRAAVIGAGTMGAAIAGLVAGAGVPVLLLDIPPNALTPDEQANGLTLQHPTVRNRIVRQGFERMCQARPANLFSTKVAELITIGNTADDFDKLGEVDWIIEAIIEKLEPKRELMARIETVRKPGALVTTNTSGIPIVEIGAGRDADFRAHFFGTHFFNPPRYLKLVEMIPGPDTDSAVFASMRTFIERGLGKGVVVCKDRPDFIANRLGIFSLMSDLRYICENGYSVEEVDALTGPLMGRPGTATFRLFDLIGIDLMAFISHHLYEALPDDENRDVFGSTALLDHMVAAGMLGNKAGKGFYTSVREGGKREFRPIDLETLEYRPTVAPAGVASFIEKAQPLRTLPERLGLALKQAVADPADRGAQLITASVLSLLAYAARRLPEIADSVADVDNAMRWGYNHEMGPFQIWDALGVAETAAVMRTRGIAVAPWVEELVASGDPHFYKQMDGQQFAYNVAAGEYQPLTRDVRAIDLAVLKQQGQTVRSTKNASLVDLGDGVLCLEFHSKANAIDLQIIQFGLEALTELEDPRWVGLVVGNQGKMFSAGANLKEMAEAIQSGQFQQIEAMLQAYQRWTMGMRYAPKPVVTAPFGRVLGGGNEIAMHSSRTVAAVETAMGLVEVGVGLIPAAGGCKEMNRRLVAGVAATPGGNPQAALMQVLETIAQAKVSGSAIEARELGFLRPTDQIAMNGDHLLGEAKQAVLDLAQDYIPPTPGNHCYALGRDGLAALRVAIHTLQEAGQASEYDAFIAERLAYVLSGGELSSPQWVEEQYFLDLERQVFLELCHEPRTHARITAMLETGKPLRN